MQPRTGWPETATSRRVSRVVCIAVAAAAMQVGAALPANAAAPVKGATYTYENSNVEGVELSVSGGGRGLRDILLSLNAKCSNGREAFGVLPWFAGSGESPKHVRITAAGSFSATFTSSDDLLDPFTLSEEYWLSGRFIRRGKAARVVVRARLTGEGGTVCESGNRRFTARRFRPGKS